jgi:hypothetical protein
MFWPSLRFVVEPVLALLSHLIEVEGSRSLVVGSGPRFSVALLCRSLASKHIFDDSLSCGGFDCLLFNRRVSMD